MIIDSIGEITPGVHVLGHAAVPVYLVEGQMPAIFDAGMTFMGEIYATQIKAILGRRQPVFCFLTHSHFDHCGSVAVFQKHFPALRIGASRKAADVLSRPHAQALIRELNAYAGKMASRMDPRADPHAAFEPFEVDQVLVDGQQIQLSADLTLQVIETPGHTWDSVSYYLPQKRTLIASEAVGTPDATGYIISDCLVDYRAYVASIEKLAKLEVETLFAGHMYAFSGSDARRHLSESLRQAEIFRKMVEKFLAEERGDLKNVMGRVKQVEYDGKTGLKQPEPAYLLNLEARVKAIQRLVSA
jgi:glyoxylase-like metal-dependent hydrolase (beta-lactamase superfamily II)